MSRCFTTFLFVLSSIGAADPDINIKTQSVLDYLKSLPQKSEGKVLSGQFIGWLDQEDTNMFQRIYDATKKYPAIMSGNYADFDEDIFEFNINTQLTNHWNQGGLVEVGIHFDNPMNNKWDAYTKVDIKRLLKFGDDINTNFNIQLDRIAIGLSDLQNAGVPVLFRPFMESNGNWFWWCEKEPSEFIDMWRYVFDYLTKFKGLHNLLWVYSINANYGNTLLYYPGEEYVDIVGLDYYSADGYFYNTAEYKDLLTTKKPIALSELGQCRSSGIGCYPKDSVKIIKSIKKEMPAIIYWNNWNDMWAMEKHNKLSKLLNNLLIVNRGDINIK